MVEKILQAAKAAAGESFSPAAEAALLALCQGAVERWAPRLRAGVEMESCAGFVTGCAWWALADFWAMEAAGGGGSFQAGDVSVQVDGAARREGARGLRQQAFCLLLPYLESDPGFAFMGVRG